MCKEIVNCVERSRMIRMLKSQSEALIEAEKQRVMIESLAGVCHHLGQPLNVLSLNLPLIQEEGLSEEDKDIIQECQLATEDLIKLINKLRGIETYRREPYVCGSDGHYSYILKI